MSEPFTAHAFDNEDAMPPLEDEHGNTIVAGAAPPATFDDMPALIRQGCENEAHSCGMVEEEEEQSAVPLRDLQRCRQRCRQLQEMQRAMAGLHAPQYRQAEADALATVARARPARRARADANDPGASNGQRRLAFAAAGGVEAVLATMSANIDDAPLQRGGCRALRVLATDSDQNQAAIAAAGGVGAVLAAARAHADDVMQRHSHGALRSLAGSSAGRQLSIVEAVLEEMRARPTDAAAQGRGCEALRQLLPTAKGPGNNTSGASNAVRTAGGIGTILAAMAAHADDTALLETACRALWRLSRNDQNRATMAAEGATERVLAVLRQHAGAGGVQGAGLAALRNLACLDFGTAAIVSASGVEVALAAMRTHASDAEGVQFSACGLLRNLATGHEGQAAVVAAGGIEVVLSAMRTHTSSALLQKEGCYALWNIACDAGSSAESNCSAITSAGGVEAVVAAMSLHESDAEVQEAGCGALWYLSVNAQNQIAIAAAGGVASVLVAMHTFPGDAQVQRPGCNALRNLAVNAQNKIAIASAGGIGLLVVALHAHVDSVEVQRGACVALWNLAVNAQNQVAIAAAGGIEAVLLAMTAHADDGIVQRHGCGALALLAAHGLHRSAILEAVRAAIVSRHRSDPELLRLGRQVLLILNGHSDEWICQACTYTNCGTRSTCEMCATPPAYRLHDPLAPTFR